ncbi:hypothetical protein ASAP_0648 [Asaia bogorensis]|uniref:Uncharacterized protein n=1 Tax=Asaia bogorensis TaxID=91915 RepID=A0A060QDG2_9PROT|nr:hypothetical protein ASAP_0648 [Asaia bogorensis]
MSDRCRVFFVSGRSRHFMASLIRSVARTLSFTPDRYACKRSLCSPAPISC